MSRRDTVWQLHILTHAEIPRDRITNFDHLTPKHLLSAQRYLLTSQVHREDLDMSVKRSLKDDSSNPTTNDEPPQKKRKGFTVGPANLPDGTYRRKTQKIKADLISKAKVKKAYAKLRAQHDAEEQQHPPQTYTDTTRQQPDEAEDTSKDLAKPEFHPERAAMLATPVSYAPEHTTSQSQPRSRPPRPRKPDRYTREREIAATRKAEQQRRTQTREARLRERKAMAKAKRPDREGKLKLGRQSKVLLGRVERLRDEGRI